MEHKEKYEAYIEAVSKRDGSAVREKEYKEASRIYWAAQRGGRNQGHH